MDSRDTNHGQTNFNQFSGAGNGEQQHQSFMYQEQDNHGRTQAGNQQTLEYLSQPGPANPIAQGQYYMNAPFPNQPTAGSLHFNYQNNPASNFTQQIPNSNGFQESQQFDFQDNFGRISPPAEGPQIPHSNSIAQSHGAFPNVPPSLSAEDFAVLMNNRINSSNLGRLDIVGSDVPFIAQNNMSITNTKNRNNSSAIHISKNVPENLEHGNAEMNIQKSEPKIDSTTKQIEQVPTKPTVDAKATDGKPDENIVKQDENISKPSNETSRKRSLEEGSNLEQQSIDNNTHLQKKIRSGSDDSHLNENKEPNSTIDSKNKNITIAQVEENVHPKNSLDVLLSQKNKLREDQHESKTPEKITHSSSSNSTEKAKDAGTADPNSQTVVKQGNKKNAEVEAGAQSDKFVALVDEKIINTPWRSLDDFRYISTDERFEATTNVLYQKMSQSLTGQHELKLLILSVINSCCLANDLPKLMTRLCMILMAFGRASYGKNPDWRFVALQSIQEMRQMFQKSNNNVIDFQSDYLKKNKMFMRVSNWLRFDMSRKAYPDILKSLEFLKSVGLDRESLEYYKILPVLKKVLTFEDQKDLINITNEILELSISKKNQKTTTKVSNEPKKTASTGAGSNTTVLNKTAHNNPKRNDTVSNKPSITKVKNKVELQKPAIQSTAQSSMFKNFLPNKHSDKKEESISSVGPSPSSLDAETSGKSPNSSKALESSKQTMSNTSFSRFLPSKQHEKKAGTDNKSESITDSLSNSESDKVTSDTSKISSASFARFLPSKNDEKSAPSDAGPNANNSDIVEVEEDALIDPKNGLKSILRRQKDTSKTIRKRRNVSVKWKNEEDLVSVKLFDSDLVDRDLAAENANLHELQSKIVPRLPVESDQTIEWHEPVAVDFKNIPWCPFIEENSTSRGGSFKIESEETDIQERRECAIGEVTVDTTMQSPHEPPDNGIGGMAVSNSNGLTLNTKIMVPF